jgi:hypothetical protein
MVSKCGLCGGIKWGDKFPDTDNVCFCEENGDVISEVSE